MSWTASAYVRQLIEAPNGQSITRSEKLILFVLADYHNTEKESAWPSVRSIARDAMFSARQTRTILRSCERKGIILIEPRKRSDGSATSNTYRFRQLLEEEFDSEEDFSSCEDLDVEFARSSHDDPDVELEEEAIPSEGAGVIESGGAEVLAARGDEWATADHEPLREPLLQPKRKPPVRRRKTTKNIIFEQHEEKPAKRADMREIRDGIKKLATARKVSF